MLPAGSCAVATTGCGPSASGAAVTLQAPPRVTVATRSCPATVTMTTEPGAVSLVPLRTGLRTPVIAAAPPSIVTTGRAASTVSTCEAFAVMPRAVTDAVTG